MTILLQKNVITGKIEKVKSAIIKGKEVKVGGIYDIMTTSYGDFDGVRLDEITSDGKIVIFAPDIFRNKPGRHTIPISSITFIGDFSY